MKTAPRLTGDAGQVGGIEVLPFGVLIFVVGTLLITNAWGVVDAEVAADAAAHQAVRTYVEAPDGTTAAARAQRWPRPRWPATAVDPSSCI